MKQKIIHTLHRDRYESRWWFGPKVTHEIYVDVYLGGKLVRETAFEIVAGDSLTDNAAALIDQAIRDAQNPPGRKVIEQQSEGEVNANDV